MNAVSKCSMLDVTSAETSGLSETVVESNKGHAMYTIPLCIQHDVALHMVKRPVRLPHPERCICKSVVNEKPRRPRLRRQASLYQGVIEEIVCHTCGAWYPISMEGEE